MEDMEKLIARYADIDRLGQVSGLLMWDQNTYMPPGAVSMRGDQQALISGLSHQMLTSNEMGSLLSRLKKKKDLNERNEAIIREIDRKYKRATSIPESLVKEISRLEPIATEKWIKAREKADFTIFKDILERMFSLKIEMAEHIGYEEKPYDALLDEYEPFMRSCEVSSVFSSLRNRLIPIVKKMTEVCKDIDISAVKKGYPIPLQESYFKMILTRMGYDFNRGRIDVTAHPFTSGGMDDVRITLRYDERDIRPGLFATIHEGGHALYEQGFLKDNYNTPLSEFISLGIHESQSRLWENIVGRSRGFWEHFYPGFQEHFPSMKDVSLDEFHKAGNLVEPSLIRVEADELTYSMHVMVRFEIETDLIEKKMDVSDIPQVWNEKYEKYLGVTPANDSMGCLQDIHWAMGAIGYFPTYTLGNLYSAQFYDSAVKENRDIEDSIQNGELAPLLSWLRENIHKHGKLYTADQLVKKLTGEPLNEDHFISYLKKKFSSIYDVQL